MDHLHPINRVFRKKERNKNTQRPLAHSANEVKPVKAQSTEDVLKHSRQPTCYLFRTLFSLERTGGEWSRFWKNGYLYPSIISGKKSTFTLVLNQCRIFATWLMAAGQIHWFPFAPLLEQNKVWFTFRINTVRGLFSDMIFSPMNWVSYSVTLFWHELVSDSTGLRVQSHKIVPTSDTSHKSLYSDYQPFCTTWWQIQGFHNPLLKFNNSLEHSTAHRTQNNTLPSITILL